MVKVKNTIIAGSAGFILSFLISIISTHSFGRSLLRALIFGVAFAGLDVGISFLKAKFLETPDSGGLADNTAQHSNAGLGNKVDITLSDDNLTDDGEGLSFAVGSNRRTMEAVPEKESETETADAGASMTNIPPVSRSSTVESVAEEVPVQNTSSFKPVQLGTADVSVSSNSDSPVIKAPKENSAAVPENLEGAAARRAQAKAEREADIKEVDELPDIGGFVPEVKADADDGVIEDSDFAVEGSSEMSFAHESSPAASSAADHDAETMSKAIRTLLHKED